MTNILENDLTPALRRKLDALKQDKEETKRTLARLTMFERNAKLNDLLVEIYGADEVLISSERSSLTKLFYSNKKSADYFDAYTMEAFNYYVERIIANYSSKLQSYKNSHSNQDPFIMTRHRIFEDSMHQANADMLKIYDKKMFATLKDKVYVPSVNQERRQAVIDYLEAYESDHALETGYVDGQGRSYSIDPETDEIIYDEELEMNL